ncbi:HTTM domain-containing protein [Streptomyces sp. ST2-7A]|nr:HTTM domain-containing protein [Streptomyces sp. ST2-7A]MCE7080624.1 HTTM domain-containing protein [Streptomyces sp. ST2-7A]
MGDRLDAALGRGIGHITRRALGPYQTAVVRIGFAFTWLFFLVREIPHRHELYGPDSPWGFDLAEQLISENKAFTVLMWTDSVTWFEIVYAFSALVSVGLLLGWRTRTMSVLFMIGVLSLQNRSVFMGDGGDNVVHLMAIYLVLTRCGQVWSLDARRRARGTADPRDPVGIVLWAACGAALLVTTVGGLLGGPIWLLCLWGLWAIHGLWWVLSRPAARPGEPRVVCDMIANVAHNAALLVIMVEVCIIYSTAGWYKIQGSRWQDGTAVYYPMNLDYFTPFPEISSILVGNALLVMILTYGTVFVQVAFPFALLNRRAKNILLAIMIGEHVGIAILLGLPFFSMAMIAMDIVFLPTVFLLWIGSRARRLTEPVRRLGRRGGGPGKPGAAPGGPDGPRVPAPATGERRRELVGDEDTTGEAGEPTGTGDRVTVGAAAPAAGAGVEGVTEGGARAGENDSSAAPGGSAVDGPGAGVGDGSAAETDPGSPGHGAAPTERR